jgi:hypothetical protein
MPKPDEVIAGIVNTLYEAGSAGWSIQDKAALVTAVSLALLPVAGNFPEKPKGEPPGKDDRG